MGLFVNMTDMSGAEPCILLVEDDLSLRGSLCQFLHEHGYTTITADTARQGWALLVSRHPRLCLLDLNLPDGSGLDLLYRIAESGCESRVVVMTAFDLEHLRPSTAARVLEGWMVKPINPAQLLSVVRRVMGDSKADCGGSKRWPDREIDS